MSKNAKKLIPLMLLSYVPPTLLLLGPFVGLHTTNSGARHSQIVFGIMLIVLLTIWNTVLYLRQKFSDDIFSAIRARGPVGYLDTATGQMHYYTDAERAAYAAEDAKERHES